MTEFFADLHIHSRFSRATSKSLTLPLLAAWAEVKGLSVIGTGDVTHPVWLQELGEQLRHDEETGLYTLKNPAQDARGTQDVKDAPVLSQKVPPVFFMLQGEISSIYKRDGKTRKVHNLVFMPHLTAAQKFCRRLAKIGNVSADGRPILGVDSRDLLEMVLETDPRAFLIPAHIWTPWYSLFGSKSGFDSIEECFGDLSSHIFALETGLSSDPAMNRLVSALDRFRLISNSDAHSPDKLGREANRFAGRIHYDGMLSALRSPSDDAETRFLGTIEYFSQEGKYYADGHRKCGVCWGPTETRANERKCPVCGKDVTVGVLSRVLELADREIAIFPDATSFQTLVPLAEIVAEIFGQGVKTRKVQSVYEDALKRFGSELCILTQADTDALNRFLNPLGEAVGRVRKGAVHIQKGYDGVYGVVQIFTDDERRTISREVGETARPQKKQVQGLSLLGETVMAGKKTETHHSGNSTVQKSREKSAASDKNIGSEKSANSFGSEETPELGKTVETKELVGTMTTAETGGVVREAAGAGGTGGTGGTGSVADAERMATPKTYDVSGNGSGNGLGDGLGLDGNSRTETPTEDGGASGNHASLAGEESLPNFLFSDLPPEGEDGGKNVDAEALPFLPLVEEGETSAFPDEFLNLEQRAAAFVDTQPTLLMAGAGTGKTYTLFGRLCHLLRQGAVPRSLLVVTFTRKAATEMDKQLLELFGEGAKLPVIDTLYAQALDLWHKTHSDVPVLLSDESARQVFGEANIDEDATTISAAWEAISLARLLLLPVADEYTAFASRYVAHKSAWNLADYTDLLEFWLEQARSGIFKPLWDYVLVDEVQELSPLGRALVSALVPPSGRGFFGVGDSDQTLYKVPGDNEHVADAFRQQWPDVQILSLMTGFRAHKGLWEVARSFLQTNGGVRGEGNTPDPIAGEAHMSDEAHVADADQSTGQSLTRPDLSGKMDTGTEDVSGAKNTHVNGMSKKDSTGRGAVNGRGKEEGARNKGAHNGQDGEAEDCSLPPSQRQAKVVSVQQHPASLHVFKAPTDEAEVQWITDKIAVLLGGITSMPDYDAKAADVFVPARTYKPGEIAVLVRSKDLGHEIRRSLSRIGIGVSEPQSDVFWADPRVRIILQLGCRMLGISLMEREGSDIPDCPDKVLAKGPLAMSAFLSTIQPFDLLFWHSKAFRELVRVYDQCGGWAGLMTWLHLQNDLELVRPHSTKVQIMTFHAAKGLEFPVVFLPCLEEGILPSAGPLLSGRLHKTVDVEGERHLLYTGAARAREALFMSYAAKRRLRGADVRLKASRFLDNLPESLVTVSTLVSKTQHQEKQLNLL